MLHAFCGSSSELYCIVILQKLHFRENIVFITNRQPTVFSAPQIRNQLHYLLIYNYVLYSTTGNSELKINFKFWKRDASAERGFKNFLSLGMLAQRILYFHNNFNKLLIAMRAFPDV